MGFFDFLSVNNDKNKTSNTDRNDNDFVNVMPFTEEYAAEMYTETNEFRSNQSSNSYSDSGVQLKEVINTLKLTYNGILAKNGAQEVFAVIGYGNNLKWEDVETYPMHKIGEQNYELVFPIKRGGNINIAFRDISENWDNNHGMNYTFVDSFYQGSH
ncbi:MAG: carbohydrate-binding protein [Clostridia bacterium]|nr:carbohydrate-binding protein [Clostridia bacterium]